jgi:hypothetical protein
MKYALKIIALRWAMAGKGPFAGNAHEKLQWLGHATKAVSPSLKNTGERSADGK